MAEAGACRAPARASLPVCRLCVTFTERRDAGSRAWEPLSSSRGQQPRSPQAAGTLFAVSPPPHAPEWLLVPAARDLGLDFSLCDEFRCVHAPGSPGVPPPLSRVLLGLFCPQDPPTLSLACLGPGHQASSGRSVWADAHPFLGLSSPLPCRAPAAATWTRLFSE
ncbi:uncharacterized protein LOC116275920 [Papio anubis]|uniref:uncharacterized protein LOC116275920 n=1 Tax=Papio anubis TaxID=9555 RepID=UPI0012ADE507|nr:uncharacterized protein LOC116275920 [Papio anubis]